MPVKPKKTTKAKTAKMLKEPAAKKAKKVKKSAAKKAIAKKTKKATKPAAKKTAKRIVARKSRATKTVKKNKSGKRKPAKTSVKKAASKAAWRISPEISQSVLQIDTWKKGDLKIEHLKVYRTGWIIVDQLPDLSGYSPDEGINIFEEFEFDEHQLHDGAKEASIFPNELPAEERARLHALSEEELEEEGWTLETVTRFKGPLVVEEV
jgi:hypothetical protein